jgi:hypothetical protein
MVLMSLPAVKHGQIGDSLKKKKIGSAISLVMVSLHAGVTH